MLWSRINRELQLKQYMAKIFRESEERKKTIYKVKKTRASQKQKRRNEQSGQNQPQVMTEWVDKFSMFEHQRENKVEIFSVCCSRTKRYLGARVGRKDQTVIMSTLCCCWILKLKIGLD